MSLTTPIRSGWRNKTVFLRVMTRAKYVSVGILSCLTLGLGFNLVMYSVVNRAFLRSMAVERPSSLSDFRRKSFVFNDGPF